MLFQPAMRGRCSGYLPIIQLFRGLLLWGCFQTVKVVDTRCIAVVSCTRTWPLRASHTRSKLSPNHLLISHISRGVSRDHLQLLLRGCHHSLVAHHRIAICCIITLLKQCQLLHAPRIVVLLWYVVGWRRSTTISSGSELTTNRFILVGSLRPVYLQ